MKKVLIIQAQMKQYRVPLFEKLHAALAEDGVELRVAYSESPPSELAKKDNAEMPAEYGIRVPGYWLFGHRILYQPLAREIARADLVIVEQANKHILNHMLLALSIVGAKRVAFWGHGWNHQANRAGLSQWWKRVMLKHVDWWFAYTERTANYVVENGFPASKITAVQNSIDTSKFRKELDNITAQDLSAARARLGLQPDARLGLFCGGITRDKMPGFLIEAAQRIKAAYPDFELVLLGGGPEESLFESAAASEPWIHYMGPKFGREKALFYRLADVFLMPGLVGLAILDAFTAGLPMITTDVPIHSPEIEYLEEGRNGIITAHDTEAYARAVVSLLSDRNRLKALQEGAGRSGEIYTIESMVDRFRHGILACLGKLCFQREPVSDACKTLLRG
jgi:glycosyltransferase involved in cell wall biosynthesis